MSHLLDLGTRKFWRLTGRNGCDQAPAVRLHYKLERAS